MSAINTVAASSLILLQPSVHERFIPIKLLGEGKDGKVLLCCKRTPKNQVLLKAKRLPTSALLALKISTGDAIGMINSTGAFLSELQRLQKDAQYPLAHIRDFDAWSQAWYSMSFVPGRSIEQLLAPGAIFEHGFPTCLALWLFIRVSQAELWLKRNGLCHLDLWAGGNVMFSPQSPNNSTKNCGKALLLPKVTLVDVGGVWRYASIRGETDMNVCHHVLALVERTLKGTPNGVMQPDDDRLLQADDEAVLMRDACDQVTALFEDVRACVREHDARIEKDPEEQRDGITLEEFWEKWGERAEVLMEVFWDEAALRELHLALNETERRIEGAVREGEMEVRVAAWEGMADIPPSP